VALAGAGAGDGDGGGAGDGAGLLGALAGDAAVAGAASPPPPQPDAAIAAATASISARIDELMGHDSSGRRRHRRIVSQRCEVRHARSSRARPTCSARGAQAPMRHAESQIGAGAAFTQRQATLVAF